MKKISNYSIRTTIGLVVTIVLILNLGQGMTKGIQTIEKNKRDLSLSSLIPHDPIFITSDSDFEVFPGAGTVEDPYVIEEYSITTTSDEGIYIIDTTKYFTVRNCYVDAISHGIYIRNVADNTATVTNNTCSNNGYNGIELWGSDSSTVANNTCTNNNQYGIFIRSSSNSTVINNTCNNNSGDGIFLDFSDNSSVSSNICNNNDYGIWFSCSDYSTVTNNTCNNNDYGIYLQNSYSSTVSNNTCTNNGRGIYLKLSYSSCVTSNICNNNSYVIYL